MDVEVNTDNEDFENFDFMGIGDDMRIAVINQMSFADFYVLFKTNKEIYNFCMTTKGINIDYYIPTMSVERKIDGLHLTKFSNVLNTFSEMVEEVRKMPLTVNISVLYLHYQLDSEEFSKLCNNLKAIPIKTVKDLHIYDNMSCWDEILDFMKVYKVQSLHITGDVDVPKHYVVPIVEGTSFPMLQKISSSVPLTDIRLVESRIPDLTFMKATLTPKLVTQILKFFLSATDPKDWYFYLKREYGWDVPEPWSSFRWERYLCRDFNTTILDSTFTGVLPSHRPLFVKQNEFIFIIREDGRAVKAMFATHSISFQLGKHCE